MADETIFEVFTPLERRRKDMDQVKVYYDRRGSTLTVWFGNPHDEYICEETGDEVILMKDKNGQVVGFEKLHFSIPAHQRLQVDFESIG